MINSSPISHTRKSFANYANDRLKNDGRPGRLDASQLRNNVAGNCWPSHDSPLIGRPQNYCNYVYLGFRMNLLQPLFCYARQRHSVIQAELQPCRWNPPGETVLHLSVHCGIASYNALYCSSVRISDSGPFPRITFAMALATRRECDSWWTRRRNVNGRERVVEREREREKEGVKGEE